METAERNYRRARRVKRCAPAVTLLSWVLTAALIVIGVRHMDRFSLFMVLALLLCLGGTFFWLAAMMHFGRRAAELAQCIAALDVPGEEKLRRAAELGLEQVRVRRLLSRYPEDE